MYHEFCFAATKNLEDLKDLATKSGITFIGSLPARTDPSGTKFKVITIGCSYKDYKKNPNKLKNFADTYS